MTDGRPPRSATLPPGFDEDDPYEDEDLSSYPGWWRRNVELFRDHGMRPYRPPTFADGTVAPPVRERLEDDLGVEIELRAVDPQSDGSWQIRVDGAVIGEFERTRTERGHSRYEIRAEAFERLVREAVGSGD